MTGWVRPHGRQRYGEIRPAAGGLYTVTDTGGRSLEEKQDDTVLSILCRLQSQREYQEVLEHMTPDGTKVAARTGEDRLWWLLDGFDEAKYVFLRRARRWRIDPWLPARAEVDAPPKRNELCQKLGIR